jgi:L-alanine-DL-glutamate epimerase-like enolase superfamily enzyme
VVASSPPFLYANQSYAMIHSDDIIVGGLEVKNGSVAVPDGPGLGVELDPDRVARAAERYRKEGEFPSRLPHERIDVTVIPKL